MASARPVRIPKNPSVLVLELNTEQLSRENLSLAKQVEAEVQRLGLTVQVVQTTTQDELGGALTRLAEARRTFHVVVVIAHSNEEGIQIACDPMNQGDGFVSWRAFTSYLNLFSTQRLLLVACEAGRSTPARALFEGLPRLSRAYASPVPMTKAQAKLVLDAVPVLLGVNPPSSEDLRWQQFLLGVRAGGQLFEWTPKDMEQPESDGFLDWCADAAKGPLASLPVAFNKNESLRELTGLVETVRDLFRK